MKIGPINVITDTYDRDIVLKLLESEIVLDKAFEEKSLNEIAEYLYKLTSLYNIFYSSNRILSENNDEIRESWLGISNEVYNTNKELLKILGIKCPKKNKKIISKGV